MFRQSALIVPLLMLAAPPAFAAAEIDADTQKALWCAAAFERIEPAIREQDEKAANQFVTYAAALRTQLASTFIASGLTQAEVDAVQSETVQQVVVELAEGGSPTYPFETCQELGVAAFKALPPATPPAAEPASEPPASP